MSDTRYLDWPFFEPHHRVLAQAAAEVGSKLEAEESGQSAAVA